MQTKKPTGTQQTFSGWFIVNNHKRFVSVTHKRLDISKDDSLQKFEYSFKIQKIVDAVYLNDKEFDLLPENSPKLHFMSDDVDQVRNLQKIFESFNFEYLHQNVPKMNDYLIYKTIGEGYSSKVQLVRRKIDHKLFALKLISKKKLEKQTEIERMVTERNVLIQNNHPFITKLYSAFQTDSHLVFALEYVGGGDLQYHLDKGLCISPPQAKIYLAQLVLTLDHLHKMGIIFRDLKPSNILIAKDGYLKLTDFGLSKSIIESGKTKSFCGTHDYLSPEMINGQPYDFSVDWWALGVIAYRLICGFLPFNSQNLSKLFDKISNCNFRFPLKIDPESRDFISGLLKKNPADRLTVEQIMSHKFFDNIDWQKIYKKEYKVDFVPYRADDESAFNFDSSLFDKYNIECYENEYMTSDSCSLSASNSCFDLREESEKSLLKDFSFSLSSNEDDFEFTDL